MAGKSRRAPDPGDDRPWTEAQWERFFQESDVRSAKFGELLETFMDHPDRDDIIAHEMGWDDDDEEGEEPAFLEDFDWEAAANDPEIKRQMEDDEAALQAIPAYRDGFKFASKLHKVLKRYFNKPSSEEEDPDEDLSAAFLNSHLIAVKIAGGHGIGYEDDALCGNIVKCRHSLAAAIECVAALERIRERGIAPAKVLNPLIEECKRLRGLVEQQIAELRSRVWWE